MTKQHSSFLPLFSEFRSFQRGEHDIFSLGDSIKQGCQSVYTVCKRFILEKLEHYGPELLALGHREGRKWIVHTGSLLCANQAEHQVREQTSDPILGVLAWSVIFAGSYALIFRSLDVTEQAIGHYALNNTDAPLHHQPTI